MYPARIAFCFQKFIEAVNNAANTSHILRTCDLLIKKCFHKLIRETRNEFCRQGTVDTTKVNINLSCAVYAWKNITPEIIYAYFKVTGTFPFEYKFAYKYETCKDEQNRRATVEELSRVKTSVAFCLAAVCKSNSDREVFSHVMLIFASKQGVSTMIQKISGILKKEEKVNSILTE